MDRMNRFGFESATLGVSCEPEMLCTKPCFSVEEKSSKIQINGPCSLLPTVDTRGGLQESWEYSLRDALFTACKVGDQDTLRRLLQPTWESGQEQDDRRLLKGMSPVGGALIPVQPAFLNVEIDDAGFTLLHVASAAGQRGAIKLLMDAGSDPACRYPPPLLFPIEKYKSNFYSLLLSLLGTSGSHLASHANGRRYTARKVTVRLACNVSSHLL